MIIDKIQNYSLYPFGPAWKTAFEFLQAATPDISDGEHKLQGDDVVARVMSYETRSYEKAILETHRLYLDIQTVLAGSETIYWFPADGLTVQTPYDESKDAAFYVPTKPEPAALRIKPGLFALFFPQDAHMPSVMCGNTPEPVKKIVIKIRADLLQ